MKNFLLVLAGALMGIGLGLELMFWTGRSYGWIREDFMIMLLAVIIGANFFAAGVLVLWLTLRRGREEEQAPPPLP